MRKHYEKRCGGKRQYSIALLEMRFGIRELPLEILWPL
tara:strand:- start:603 stop:716 length:114 start_codon:yes stop_codon:yes gene_type:complete